VTRRSRPDATEKKQNLKLRGYCTGPEESEPGPGEVGAGPSYYAHCRKCGKRVSVTKCGRYAHHKPARIEHEE
jgi:hypothetical protein